MRTVNTRGQSESSDDRFARLLEDALRPQPLPEQLAERIRADFDGCERGLGRRSLPAVRTAAAAVAAGLLLAIMLPWNLHTPRGDSPTAFVLSDDEAAVIVAAFGVVSWDSPIDYTLEAVNASLSNIERALEGGEEGENFLDWAGDDGWDLPAPIDDGASKGSETQDQPCFVGVDRWKWYPCETSRV